MLACPKVLILLLLTHRFEAHNPNWYEEMEAFPPDMQRDSGEGVMARYPPGALSRVVKRSRSCTGDGTIKNQDFQGCQRETNSEENREEDENEMKMFSRLRRFKPIRMKQMLKSCINHDCNSQEEPSAEQEVNTKKLFSRLRRLKSIDFHRLVRIAKRMSLPSSDSTGQYRQKTYTTRMGKREDSPKWTGKKGYMMRIAKRTSTAVPRNDDDDTNEVAKKMYITRLGKRGKEDQVAKPKFRMMGKKAYMMRIGKRSFFVLPNLKLLKLMKLLYTLMSSDKRV